MKKLIYFFILIGLTCNINAGEPKNIEQLFELTHSARSSKPSEFSSLLLEITARKSELSKEQLHTLLYFKGYQKAYAGESQAAIGYYVKALEGTTSNELIFRVSLSMANTYSIMRNWTQALLSLEKSLTIGSEINTRDTNIEGALVAAIIYNQLDQSEIALSYLNNLFENKPQGRNLCFSNWLELEAKAKLNQIDIDDNKFTSVAQFCESISEPVLANLIRIQQVKSFLTNKEFTKAESTIDENIEAIIKTDYNILIAHAFSLKSIISLNLNKIEEAKVNAEKSLEHTGDLVFSIPKIKALEVLYLVYVHRKDFEEAVMILQEQAIAEKGYMNEQTAKQLAFQRAKMEVLEKNHEIESLNKQNKIVGLELETQKKMQVVWGVTFFSIAILIFFLLYRRTSQKELARQKQVNWELKELDKLKDRILTNTSHELRTPLNGIIGLSDLILLEYENELEDELVKSIRLIGKSGTRLSLIVNDILDLAQLKSRRVKFTYEHFNIAPLISDVILLCRPLIKTKNVQIVFKQENQELLIKQEKHRIQQVLFNLIGNAIKFTEKGRIIVNCEIDSEFLKVSIQDTGIGIPKNKVDRVFMGFEQVDNSNQRKHEGSGIGLAICKELITALGGTVKLESELNVGTLVSFSVPLLK